MKTKPKDAAILALALFLVVAAFTVDVFFFPGIILPGPPFFLSILIAAYFLSSRTTAGVAVFATALKLAADLLQGTPTWLLILYFIALMLVGLAGMALSQRIRRETALAQTLRESEERFRAIFEQAAVGIAHVGLDGRFLRVNQRMCDIVGYTREEMSRLRSQDITYPEDLEADTAQANRLLAGEIDTYSMEKRYIRKDGSLVWANLTKSLVRAQAGDAQFFIGVVEDITDRKLAEQERERLLGEVHHLADVAQRRATELHAANKELEAFSYSVSHDLRAPLRHIDGFSKILLEDYADRLDETGQEYLHFVREGSHRMDQLIDALLKLSRAIRAEMRRQPVNLSDLAESILAELHKEQPDRQVELTVAPGVIADGDPALLRIVLENLLGNAWKFTARRPIGRIEFGATQRDGQHAYCVRDNGAGFDMAYADKLFGAFQRLHKAEEFPGTGIGLATVQRIIHRHGGRVWAEAEVDKGATFHFTLG